MNEKISGLMKPRYEVIADYFFSPYQIGSVIAANEHGSAHLLDVPVYDSFDASTTDSQHFFPIEICRKYPALYKELKWWQHRKAEEMPEYVFSADKKKVFKVDKSQSWSTYFKVENGSTLLWEGRTPATQQDYEAYLKTKMR